MFNRTTLRNALFVPMAIALLSAAPSGQALAQGGGGHGHPAQGGGHGGGKGGHGGGHRISPMQLERYAEQLDLSEATLTAIQDRAYATQKEMIRLEAELKAARLDLKRILEADKPDKKKAMDQVQKVGDLETALRQQEIGLLVDVFGMLTPEQREQLKQLRIQEREERLQERGEGPGRD